MPYNLIVILGPTASGKTSFAAHLAYRLQSEIISADSRQVYRGMNLGTGKDYDDYTVHDTRIPYHLIDIFDAGYKYNVYQFQHDFINIFNRISERGKIPILCGGTGLYIEAAIKNYRLINVPHNEPLRQQLTQKTDHELVEMLANMKTLHNSTDTDDRERTLRSIEIETYYQQHPEINERYPKLNPLVIGVKYNRDTERQRITQRLQQRLDNGMIQEVEELLHKGLSADDLIYYGLEYKYITLHLTGELTYKQMFDRLNTAIHQFAKRQMTWFRRMERNGTIIHWLDGETSLNSKVEQTIVLLNLQQ